MPYQNIDATVSPADVTAIKAAFDAVHLQRYGTSAPKELAELVSLRVTVIGAVPKPPQLHLDSGGAEPAKDALRAAKQVYFRESGGFVAAPVYRRTKLLAGNRILGPALIEEHGSTTVVAPGDALTVDPFGNLDVFIGSRA